MKSDLVNDRAKAFTAALDAGAWEDVSKCLTTNCEYVFRGNLMSGAGLIVDMYRSIGEWVEKTFDSVRYESSLESLHSESVKIKFRDIMDHRGHHLDFRCEQIIRVNSEGLIDRIEHFDLPGESEKAARFNEACGVTRPGPS